MQPPKSHWSLVYYQHPKSYPEDIEIKDGASEILEGDGWHIIGRHMYTEPLLGEGGFVEGTRYVFALVGAKGTGHYDIPHDFTERTLTLYPEPAVTADHDVSDAELEADARSQQAADERHAERMRYGR